MGRCRFGGEQARPVPEVRVLEVEAGALGRQARVHPLADRPEHRDGVQPLLIDPARRQPAPQGVELGCRDARDFRLAQHSRVAALGVEEALGGFDERPLGLVGDHALGRRLRERPAQIHHGVRARFILVVCGGVGHEALAPVLETIVNTGDFVVADLAGMLDGPSRLVLVRRLIREGLIEMVPSEREVAARISPAGVG